MLLGWVQVYVGIWKLPVTLLVTDAPISKVEMRM